MGQIESNEKSLVKRKPDLGVKAVRGEGDCTSDVREAIPSNSATSVDFISMK